MVELGAGDARRFGRRRLEHFFVCLFVFFFPLVILDVIVCKSLTLVYVHLFHLNHPKLSKGSKFLHHP